MASVGKSVYCNHGCSEPVWKSKLLDGRYPCSPDRPGISGKATPCRQYVLGARPSPHWACHLRLQIAHRDVQFHGCCRTNVQAPPSIMLFCLPVCFHPDSGTFGVSPPSRIPAEHDRHFSFRAGLPSSFYILQPPDYIPRHASPHHTIITGP